MNDDMMNEIATRAEAWLNERWNIATHDGTAADKSYYNGATKAVEMLGFDWRRDEVGKHRIFPNEIEEAVNG